MLAISVIAGMLMLLLAVSCVALTPLEMSGQKNCTNCSANSSISPGFVDAAKEADSSNSSVGQVLAAPVLKGPKGILNSGELTYQWVPVNGCQYYCLEIKDHQKGVVLKQWYEASDFAQSSDNTISVTPPQSLDPGDYTWRILCRKCNSNDQLSLPMEFTVCTSSSLPGRATLISPKDNIGSLNPTFVWMPVTGCTLYRLKVAYANLPNEPIFVSDDLNVEDVFSEADSLCTYTPDLGLDLEAGTYYRWWIQAINCKGEGPWSYYKNFRYLNRPPGRSTPQSPQGLISTNTPIFTWTTASAATEYHLEVINDNDEIVDEGWFDADKVTKGLKCSAMLTPLPDDDIVYYWRIQAINDADDGEGPWSSYRYFETVCASKPGTDKKKARTG